MPPTAGIPAGHRVRRSRRVTAAGLVACAALIVFSAPARAWGPALHAYIDWRAREDAALAGVSWQGLDLMAYIAGSPAPDIWYAAEEAGVVVPAGIEEDWELVRLLLAESKTIEELSFVLGYAGHIQGDVQGHKIYLSPNGNSANHLIRDAAVGFVLFGAFDGYAHVAAPLDLLLGSGLDVERGTQGAPGSWRWGGFDEGFVDLLVRSARRWCDARSTSTPGCPVAAATVRKLRDTLRSAVNAGATLLSFPGYYTEASTAARNAALVKTYDDKEFGPGAGPARLAQALTLSVDETRARLFERPDVVAWINASAAPAAEVARLFDGPPPGFGAEEGGGCTVGPGPDRFPGGLLLAIGLLVIGLPLRWPRPCHARRRPVWH